MLFLDTKSEDISLSSNIIRSEEQIPDNHRLSKKILRISKNITSYFSFYQPLISEKNEDMTNFSLLCNQLEQQKVFELDITDIQYPLKKFLLFVNALKKNKSLKILTLTSNKIHSKKLAKLCLSLKQMPLEELKLKGNKLTDSSMSQLKGALRGNKNLRVIDFSSNNIGDQGLKFLCSIFENQPLEKLDLSSNQICSIFPLIKALKNNTSLRVLNFSSNYIKSLRPQFSLVFQNAPLEELDLCVNKLSSSSIPSLKKALKNNRTLKVLKLSHNMIGDEGLITLCSIFKNMPLEKLVLSRTNIGDGSMFPLRKSLKNNRTLKVLKLSNNMIRDEGLAALCPILKNMPLEILNLGGNQIENVPPEFYSFLKNSLVKTVNLYGNMLTETSIKGIALALKDNMHIKSLEGLSEDEELMYTFYPLMDLLISFRYKLSTRNAENDLRISTKNFPRSLRALNNAFEAHIPVADLVDIIFSYTFNVDTLCTLLKS